MKRTFLVSLRYSNKTCSGYITNIVVLENRGFRVSDISEAQNRAEQYTLNEYGEKVSAAVLHVSELETEE